MNDFVECKTEKFVSERYSKNVKSLARVDLLSKERKVPNYCIEI